MYGRKKEVIVLLVVLALFILIFGTSIYSNWFNSSSNLASTITGAAVGIDTTLVNPIVAEPEIELPIPKPVTENITGNISESIPETDLEPSPEQPIAVETEIEEPTPAKETISESADKGGSIIFLTDANSTQCGDVSNSLSLTADIRSNYTCFNIIGPNVVLDGSGFTISSNGTGFGINITGFDNITIKNFANIYNFSIGINFTNAKNITIYNNSLQSDSFTGTGYDHNIVFSNVNSSNISSNNLTVKGASARSIYFFKSNYNTVRDNKILSPSSNIFAASATGISLRDNSSFNNLSNNIIYLFSSEDEGSSSTGIGILESSMRNNISYNNITINVSGFGLFMASVNNNSFYGNNINLSFSEGQAIHNYFSNDSFFYGNNLTTTGADSVGIDLSNVVSNTFENNNLDARGTGSIGITNLAVRYSQFINNNISTLDYFKIQAIESGSNPNNSNNSLIYNNSFGLINWTKGNLTTNLSLQIGTTIFIESNNTGVLDSAAQNMALNSTAQIILRGLTFISTPLLMKNNVRCDNTNSCNISYNSTSGVLYANISSFSNYTAQTNPCGVINSSATMNLNLVVTATCFTINASNIIINGAGFTITSNGTGFGVTGAGFHNITIKNFANLYNFSMAVNITDAKNITIHNNTFQTDDKRQIGDGHTIQFINVNSSNITLNNLTTFSPHGYPIYFSQSSYNIIQDNIILSLIRASWEIWLVTNTAFNNITNNIIRIIGPMTTTVGIGIAMAVNSNNNNFSYNNISTNETSYGLYVSSSSNNSFYWNNINNSYKNSHGLVMDVNSNQNVFYGNNFSTVGTDSTGIDVGWTSESNLFENNKIETRENGSIGIKIQNVAQFNQFINNNVSTNVGPTILDMNSSTTNSLIYNTSLGMINWTKTNLSTNISLILGTTIFLQSNNTGVIDNGTQNMALNDTAQIILRGLTLTSTPLLLKNGVRCDDTNACNITYNSTSGVLYANISSFSNYTAQAISCGTVNGNLVLTENISHIGTCFTLAADNIVLDGSGFYIRTNGTNGDLTSGVTATNFSNITVKNFGGIINYSRAISLINATNFTFFNNTVRGANVSGSTYIFAAEISIGLNITSNNLTAVGAADGSEAKNIFINSSGAFIYSNKIHSLGTESPGIFSGNSYIDNLTIINNNLTSNEINSPGIKLLTNEGTLIQGNIIETFQNTSNPIALNSLSAYARIVNNTLISRVTFFIWDLFYIKY